MFKQIISGLFLLGLCSILTGCHREEIVQKENLKEEEKITAVVFPSGESIQFDYDGGRLRYENENISGKGQDGSDLVVPLVGISEIRTKIYPPEQGLLSGGKITELTWQLKKQFIFDEKGGFYDKDSALVKGYDIKFGEISLPVAGITSIFTAKADTVSIDKIRTDTTIRVKQLVYSNRIVRTFDDNGGHYNKPGYFIVGISKDGKNVSVGMDEVLYTKVQKTDAVNTTFAVLGGCIAVVGIAALIVAATKESCPFIYSFDGQKYVFDAEPLGGATSKGLKRGEFSKLEYLNEISGKYKLKVINEVAESQYIDALSLYIVDHPENTEAVVNNDGKVYLTKNIRRIVSADDEDGRDLSKFLINEDGIMWQTKMPVLSKDKPVKTRSRITFAFVKPDGENTVNLIINVGTSLWGSNMIKEMLVLYGNQVDSWYDKIDERGVEYNQMMNFLQREELYELKLYLKEKTGWEEKTVIQGGGPFISERRIIPLDISQTEGDTLFLRVNPPCGFWSFDYAAMESGEITQTKGIEVTMTTAIDYLGTNITDVINKNDENYYIMPETGNHFNMEFDPPVQQKDMKRTVFLRSSGYYKIHLPGTNPPDIAKLLEISMKPGRIVDYSFDKYIEWHNEGIISNK